MDTVYFSETAFRGQEPEVRAGYLRGLPPRLSRKLADRARRGAAVTRSKTTRRRGSAITAWRPPGSGRASVATARSPPPIRSCADIPTTILSEFGVQNGPGMIGKSVF